MLKQLYKSFHSSIWHVLLKTEAGYRFFLKKRYGVSKPTGVPDAPWNNSVLKNQTDVENALEQAQVLKLFPHSDPTKYWDSLAALDCILKKFDKKDYILDAGAEIYSTILPWLFTYGYKNLIGINLVFESTLTRGPIQYIPGDITNTKFKDSTFDAITCLSVIEHGVDLSLYFEEMYRILKPGGILITSADYYDPKIDTNGKKAYGVPIHIFSKDEILTALKIAEKYGFLLPSELDLNCQEKVVHWKEYDLDYTYIIFTLNKKADING